MAAAAQSSPARRGPRSSPVARVALPEGAASVAVAEEAARHGDGWDAEESGTASNGEQAGARTATTAAPRPAHLTAPAPATATGPAPGRSATAPAVATTAAAVAAAAAPPPAPATTRTADAGGPCLWVTSRTACSGAAAGAPEGAAEPPPQPPPVQLQHSDSESRRRRRRSHSDDGGGGGAAAPTQRPFPAPPPPPAPPPFSNSKAAVRSPLPHSPSAAAMTPTPSSDRAPPEGDAFPPGTKFEGQPGRLEGQPGRRRAGAGPGAGGAATATAGGGGTVATTATAAAAAAAASGDVHGALLQPSLAIAAAITARGPGLRRRTGSHAPVPSPQPPPAATSATTSSPLRNCTAANRPYSLLGCAQDEAQPLARPSRTRLEAALSVRSSSGGGGGGGGGVANAGTGGGGGGGAGGDGDGGGGGGAVIGRFSVGGLGPPDVDEHQRLSWGSYTEDGGGNRFGCPYEYGSRGDAAAGCGDESDDGDEDHRHSWGSYDAVTAVYGSCGGGAALLSLAGTRAGAGSSGGAGGGGDPQAPLLPIGPAAAAAAAAAAATTPPGSPVSLLTSPEGPSPPRSVSVSVGMGMGVGVGVSGGSVVARQRWQRAVAAVGQVRRLHRQAKTLADKESAPEDRLFAALSLALQRAAWDQLRAANPHRRLLRHYVEKKAAGRWGSCWERVEAEFVITGTIIFDWCTPARMGEHWPLFTAAFLGLAALLFAFMAAQYPYFAALEAAAAGGCSGLAAAAGGADPVRVDQCWSSCLLTAHSGPRFLLDVVVRPGSHPATRFSGTFLAAWGGLYLPAVGRGQAFRWLTSQFVHTSFRHVAANFALTAALGWQMEVKYGTVRVMAVWLAAVVGGELLAAAVEDPCRQVVGCSGGAFGLLGLFCADTLLHYPTLRQPILRCAAIAVLLGFLVFTLVQQQDGTVSSMTHVGGLLCGLLPSLLVLPRLGSERWEAAWPALGLAAVLAWFSVLPAWVYTRRLPYAAATCEPLAAAAAEPAAPPPP